jgi:polysaccharide chain length determinant protein (PEP-CTERM system associated)
MLGHRALNVEDYLAILKRRWWIVAIPAMILPVVAIAATHFIAPEYVSSTLVLIDQQKVPTEFVKPVATDALDSRLAYMTEKILSRSSIEPIILHYNLYADQHLSMDARVDLTRKALKIEAIQSEIARSNGLPGFRIAFTANDPQTAQQVCAEITSLFTKINLKDREGRALDTTAYLTEQLNTARQNLADQDKKIADFQKQYSGMLPGEEGSNVNIMSSLNSRLDATTQTLQNLEQNKSVGETMLAAQTQPATTTAAAIEAAPQTEQKELDTLLQQEADLSAHYTDEYPEVKAIRRKIQDLRAQMAKQAAAPPPPAPVTPAPPSRADSANVTTLRAQLHSIDVEIALKRKEQEALQAQIRGYEGRIQSSPAVQAQFKELTRDYETASAFYNNLLQKNNMSQMTTDLENRQEGETFTVLDLASLPTEPTFPKVPVFAGGGIVAGLVFGILIVALLEYKDTALRTEREVWDFTHLPTLAVIAWSGEAAEVGHVKRGRLKRLFGRKPPKELLADA